MINNLLIKLSLSLSLSLVLGCLLPNNLFSQKHYCTTKNIESITNKAESYNTKIDKQTAKYLNKIEKQEKKLKRKIAKLDSTAAKELFDKSQQNYTALKNKITNKAAVVKANKITQYIPGLDSITTSLQFLKENNVANAIKEGNSSITKSLDAYQQLQSKLEVTNEITNYLKQRKELLKTTLEKYNVGKYLKKYNKAAYYYSAQINEYKALLKDPVKAEKLLLTALNKIPQFKEFFAQFSVLGQLFPMPQNSTANVANLAGLQTRAQVMQIIQTNFGGSGTGPNAGIQALQQNIQEAQNELQKLKNKVMENMGGGDADFSPPTPEGGGKPWRPNNEKTKPFIKRWELKTDLQSNKGNGLLPNIADVAVGIGYKFDDKKIAGIQVAYKLGLGNGLNAIKLSTQGVSYRSYIDFKFNKNIWLSGGYEVSKFTNLLQDNNALANPPFGGWGGSALLGLSKKYSITKKRKGEAKILYNFLWQQQPNAQKIIFRTGLNF
jgi:hypothetical protein